MSLNLKPVFVLSRETGAFLEPSGRLEVVNDGKTLQARIQVLLEELKEALGPRLTLLQELVVGEPAGFEPLFRDQDGIDVLLVYFLGVTPIEALLRWKKPIIAFGGVHTPMMPLYAIGEERHLRKDLFLVLDYAHMGRILRILEVKKGLEQTRIVLFGQPPPWHLRWYGFPDLEALRRRLGVTFTPVELRELLEVLDSIEQDKVASLARRWTEEADEVVEPSLGDLQETAAIYLAMEGILERKGAGAMTINCLEMTQSRKFSGQLSNPCLAMTKFEDQGISCGCEMDIPALLTKILLGGLSRKPTFMGNIVRADPGTNHIKLSHCILPTRMPGFDREPLACRLRDFHGRKGVTASVPVPGGTTVTLARFHRNLERVAALTGEVVTYEDTASCRNTVTIRVPGVEEFIAKAEGNHHIMAFGDYSRDLEVLCGILGCECTLM